MASPVITVAYNGDTYEVDTEGLSRTERTKALNLVGSLAGAVCALADLDTIIADTEGGDTINVPQRRDVVVGQRDRLVRDLTNMGLLSE